MGASLPILRHGAAAEAVGVPLSQLEVPKAKTEMREAVEDWRYWVGMGYEF